MAKLVKSLGRALVVTLTVGVAFGLAGCGNEAGSGPGVGNQDNVVQSGNAGLTRETLISTTYDAAMKAGSTHMAMTTKGGAAASAEGDVSYADGKAAMQMKLSMPQFGEREMQMRYVDEVIYMQIPGVTPTGKFVTIDPNNPSSPLDKAFEGLGQQMDPLGSVKTMESSVTKVQNMGRAEVGGVSTDRYRVTVDATKMMKKLEHRSPAGVPESITYDMWLDEKNLIRKMTFGVAGSSVELLFSKWGQDVEVERPAADDIVKAPSA